MNDEMINKLNEDIRILLLNLIEKLKDKKIAIYSFKSRLRILGVKVKVNFELSSEDVKKINRFKQIEKFKKYFNILSEKEKEFQNLSFSDFIFGND